MLNYKKVEGNGNAETLLKDLSAIQNQYILPDNNNVTTNFVIDVKNSSSNNNDVPIDINELKNNIISNPTFEEFRIVKSNNKKNMNNLWAMSTLSKDLLSMIMKSKFNHISSSNQITSVNGENSTLLNRYEDQQEQEQPSQVSMVTQRDLQVLSRKSNEIRTALCKNNERLQKSVIDMTGEEFLLAFCGTSQVLGSLENGDLLRNFLEIKRQYMQDVTMLGASQNQWKQSFEGLLRKCVDVLLIEESEMREFINSVVPVRFEEVYKLLRDQYIWKVFMLQKSSAAVTSKKRCTIPKATTEILKAWLQEHFMHPYPTEDEKKELRERTSLTLSQINNWFINARGRLWKPTIQKVVEKETYIANNTPLFSTTTTTTGSFSQELNIFEQQEEQ